MQSSYAGPLAAYNSLTDVHLVEYFSSPRRLRHLRRMGLITHDGRIVEESVVRMNAARKEHQRCAKELLAATIVSKAIEIEKKRRAELKQHLELLAKFEMVERIKSQKRHPDGVQQFNPLHYSTPPPPPYFPTSLHTSHDDELTHSLSEFQQLARKAKTMPTHRPPSPYIRQQRPGTSTRVPHPPSSPKPRTPMNVTGRRSTVRGRRPNTAPVTGSHATTPQSRKQNQVHSEVQITLCYVGRNLHLEGSVDTSHSDVTVIQQHCGGNTVPLYKGRVRPRECFTFISRRHLGMPFGLTFYLDGMMDSRVSACCEFRHQCGKLLGSKSSHFRLVKVEGGRPCYRCEAKKHAASKLHQEEDEPLSKEEGHKSGSLAGAGEKKLPQLNREREMDLITKKYSPNLPSPSSSQLHSQSEILTSELNVQQAQETNVTLSPDAKQSSPAHSSQVYHPQPLKSSVETEERSSSSILEKDIPLKDSDRVSRDIQVREDRVLTPTSPTSSSKPTLPQSEPNTFSPISNTAPKLTSSPSSDADKSLVAASLEYKDTIADTGSKVSVYDYEDDVFEHDEGEVDAGDGEQQATETVERLTPCVPTSSPDCINVETQTNSDNMEASVVTPTEADQYEEMHKCNITPERKGNSSTEVSTPGEDLSVIVEDNSYSMDKLSPEQQPNTQAMANDITVSQSDSPSATAFADGSSAQDMLTLAAQEDDVQQESPSSGSLGSLSDERESEHGSISEVSKSEDGEISDSQQQRIDPQVIAPTHNESNLNSTSVNSLDTAPSSIPQNGTQNDEDITDLSPMDKPHSEEDVETEDLEQVTNSLELVSKTDLEKDAGQLPRLGNEASPVSLQLDTSPLIDSSEHLPLEGSPAPANYNQEDSSTTRHSSSLTSVSTDSSI